MTKYYKNYFWKDGLPQGVTVVEEITHHDTFKIIADPYHKRVSIEKYIRGAFASVIYDSILLDFRHLKKPDQTAWQKLPVEETKEMIVCLIRDQDDRILFTETHLFVDDFCRECRVSAPHGVLLSIHKMFYKSLGDSFDGVVLFDINEHPVMVKQYTFDPLTRQFTDLLSEEWQMENHPLLASKVQL